MEGVRHSHFTLWTGNGGEVGNLESGRKRRGCPIISWTAGERTVKTHDLGKEKEGEWNCPMSVYEKTKREQMEAI